MDENIEEVSQQQPPERIVETVNLKFREIPLAGEIVILSHSPDDSPGFNRLTSYLPALNNINTGRAAELEDFARKARSDPQTVKFTEAQGYHFLQGDELDAKLNEARELITEMVGAEENQRKFACQELKMGTAVALGPQKRLNVIIGVVAKGNVFYILFHPVPDLELKNDQIQFAHMGEIDSGHYKPYTETALIDQLYPVGLFKSPFFHSLEKNYPLEEVKAV